jgi:hypothetical protein
MIAGRSDEEILQRALRNLESSLRRIAHAANSISIDEGCFERTRTAIARSKEILQAANPGIPD